MKIQAINLYISDDGMLICMLSGEIFGIKELKAELNRGKTIKSMSELELKLISAKGVGLSAIHEWAIRMSCWLTKAKYGIFANEYRNFCRSCFPCE